MDENPAGRETLSTPELIKDLTVAIRKQGWKPKELRLRQQEVRRSFWVGVATAVATVVVAFATVRVAVAASAAAISAEKAVNVAQMAIDSQTKEARFSTAVQALGGNQPAERVAGAIMLRFNVQDRFDNAQNAKEQLDAFRLYVATETILENYLKTPVEPPSSTTQAVPPAVTVSGQNPLVGAPAPRPARLDPSREHVDVAQQVYFLLDQENQGRLHKFNSPRIPSVDLANVELARVSWSGVDFSWLEGKYLLGIDLRGATLEHSKWGDANLDTASFQCANLTDSKFSIIKDNKLIGANLHGAKLQHANLQNADLRSANLQNADLRSADVRGADLTGAYVDGARFDGAQLIDAATSAVIGASVGEGKLLQGDPKREQFDVRCNGWDQ